jgi:hypothetical protein
MQLEKIITLANARTRLMFLAMERSLRATGCKLPLWVIPYDENRFDLPPNATWWEDKNCSAWIHKHRLHPQLGKYQCLLVGQYQFVDTDVIFLKNPESILSSHTGFITCCGHWHNPQETCTPESLALFKSKTTIWQKNIFNAGQVACDRALYSFENLVKTAALYPSTCMPLKKPYTHEQSGLNLLVMLSQVQVTNLSLSYPYLESSWAGDYRDANFEQYWKNPEQKPYLIHWAGHKMRPNQPISRLFFNYLTQSEKEEYLKTISLQKKSYLSKLYRALRFAKKAFQDNLFSEE